MPSTPKPNAASPSRRTFCSAAATCCGAAVLLGPAELLHAAGQDAAAKPLFAEPPATPSRPDVAAVDRDRILAAAERYLVLSPTPLTSLPCPRSPGTAHDYYSEALPEPDPDAPPATKAPQQPFTAHRDALFTLGLAVPALTAAYLLTGEERYAEHAAAHLHAWFIDPATSMTPRLDFGSVLLDEPAPESQPATPAAPLAAPPSLNAPPTPAPAAPNPESAAAEPETGRYQGILETLPLVEIAQSIPFLAPSAAFSKADQNAVRAWFAAYQHWLTAPQDSGPRLAALARDHKDHHGSSWLLQVTAFVSLAAPIGDVPRTEDNGLTALRQRFKAVTLRAQISPEGMFRHELGSDSPYRDSLFNLDMLAGVCQLLSTRFENVWDYALEEGPSMRTAIAYHFPFIADRGRWPFRADNQHFEELPARRASLLFTARAYQRPEYAALWKTLRPDPPDADILRTLPIQQPMLWVIEPPRSA